MRLFLRQWGRRRGPVGKFSREIKLFKWVDEKRTDPVWGQRIIPGIPAAGGGDPQTRTRTGSIYIQVDGHQEIKERGEKRRARTWEDS